MTVGIVFVNYFSADQIAERVRAYEGADVLSVVVDNSGDYRGPGLVVGDGQNIGFGSACNLGVRALDRSIGEVILHNPDVYPTAQLLEEAASRVVDRSAGIVAPSLLTPEGTLANGYSYPRLTAEAVTSRSIAAVEPDGQSIVASSSPTPRSAVRGIRAVVRSASRGPRFGSGALLAVNVAAFHNIGGFDERFILYGEDLDFWHRMTLSGASTVFANDLSAFHERGGGSPASRQTRDLLRFAGIQLFVQLHQPKRWKLYRAIHQRALRAVPSDNPIGALLRAEWRAGHDPERTSRTLRTHFIDGVMAQPGANAGIEPTACRPRNSQPTGGRP